MSSGSAKRSTEFVSPYRAFHVPSRWVYDHWGDYWPLLRACQRHDLDGFEEHELKQRVLDGEFTCMQIVKSSIVGVALCRKMMRNDQPALEVAAVAGDGWLDWGETFIDALEAMARRGGAKEIVLRGRRGWERHLQRYGFKTIGVVMAMETEQ